MFPVQVRIFAITFLLSLISGLILIPVLKRLRFGQRIRKYGPASHLKKQGIPTFGGLIFVIPLLIACILYSKQYAGIIPLLLVTLGFTAVGFIDDYIKVKVNKEGLSPKQKSILQILVAVCFSYYIFAFTSLAENITVPYLDFEIPPLLYAVFIAVLFYFMTNAVNFTDGVDGLCAGISFIVFSFFVLVAMSRVEWDAVKLFSSSFAGGCLGFLAFNRHPAKIIMGDTGSLALGGAVTAIAVMLKLPLILLVVGAIYIVEALSVIIQVASFKLRGKRVFKMAPIHHHFELTGWKETKIVAVFYTVTVGLCLLGLLLTNFR